MNVPSPIFLPNITSNMSPSTYANITKIDRGPHILICIFVIPLSKYVLNTIQEDIYFPIYKHVPFLKFLGMVVK